MTAVLRRVELSVNSRYAHVSPGLVQAVYLPSGSWSAKVRLVGDAWTGFAVPRGATSGAPFVIVSGPDEAEVFSIAVRWADSARTLGMRMDRVVFAGYGDALGEQPADVGVLAVAA